MEWEKLSVSEFIKKTRPDGKGKIYLNGELISEFTEVVCDFCNKEMLIKNKNNEEDSVYLTEGYAICEECYKKRYRR